MLTTLKQWWGKMTGKRQFIAARTDRTTSDWILSPVEINDDIRANLKTLVMRSRDLAKNNSDYRKWLSMRRKNVLGPNGIKMQAKVKNYDGTQDLIANSILEAGWKDWGMSVDMSGQYGWSDFVAMVDRTFAVDGECFFRKILGRQGGKYGLRLQLIDSQLVDIDYNEAGNGRTIIMGVEIDEYMRPLAYHIRKSGYSAYGTYVADRTRIPANEIIHYFEPEFVGQVRGYPRAAAAILDMNMQAGFRDAMLIAARVSACQMGVWERQANASGKLSFDKQADSDGKAAMDMEPGKFTIAPKGWTMKQLTPSHPSNMAADFMKAVSRSQANGLDVAYNDFANDLEGVSFSSIRSGTLSERETWKIEQQRMINHVCKPIAAVWLEQFLMMGLSNLPISKYDKFNSLVWIPRRWDWVDPMRDIKADREAIDLHVMSPQEVIRDKGRDPEEVLEEISAWKDLIKSNNLEAPQDGKKSQVRAADARP